MEPFFTSRHEGPGSDHSPLPKKEVGTSAAHPPHLPPSSVCIWPFLIFLCNLLKHISMPTNRYAIVCLSLIQFPLSLGHALSNWPCDSHVYFPLLATVRALRNLHFLSNSSPTSYKTLTLSTTLNPGRYLFLSLLLAQNSPFKHLYRSLACGSLLHHTDTLQWSATLDYLHPVPDNIKVINHELPLSYRYLYLQCLISLYHFLK